VWSLLARQLSGQVTTRNNNANSRWRTCYKLSRQAMTFDNKL